MKNVIKVLLILFIFSLGSFFGFLGGIKYAWDKETTALNHCPVIQKIGTDNLVKLVECLNGMYEEEYTDDN